MRLIELKRIVIKKKLFNEFDGEEGRVRLIDIPSIVSPPFGSNRSREIGRQFYTQWKITVDVIYTVFCRYEQNERWNWGLYPGLSPWRGCVDGEVDASENETKFGRQVGGRETINYGGVVGGVGRMLNARLRLVTQAVGAPRQLWIKRAAWPQPLVPASNGRHRVSPRATWQRAICYFALSATRSLINLAALFAGRSACFIPRSGRHIPPDSLPSSLSLSLSLSSSVLPRSIHASKIEGKDGYREMNRRGFDCLDCFFQFDFLNKKKKKRSTEFFIRDWRTFDGYTSRVNNLVFFEIYHVTCSNWRYIFLSFIESHGQQTNESEDTSWNAKRYHRTEKKRGKKKTIHEQFLHQLEKYPIIPNVNIIGFFFARTIFFPLDSLRRLSRASNTFDIIRYESVVSSKTVTFPRILFRSVTPTYLQDVSDIFNSRSSHRVKFSTFFR